MLEDMLTTPCVIVHRSGSGEEDDYGDPIDVETLEESVCYLEQKESTEPASEREFTKSIWLCVLPSTVQATTKDALIAEGWEHEFVGDPWPVENPRTRVVHHLEASIRRVRAEEEEAS